MIGRLLAKYSFIYSLQMSKYQNRKEVKYCIEIGENEILWKKKSIKHIFWREVFCSKDFCRPSAFALSGTLKFFTKIEKKIKWPIIVPLNPSIFGANGSSCKNVILIRSGKSIKIAHFHGLRGRSQSFNISLMSNILGAKFHWNRMQF